MARRCKSWRYTPTPGHQQHLPGKCRSCWRPCREKVGKGVTRCGDCRVALASCPDPQVRRALLAEQPADQLALELLADDANPVIAATARQKLAAFNTATAPALTGPSSAADKEQRPCTVAAPADAPAASDEELAGPRQDPAPAHSHAPQTNSWGF